MCIEIASANVDKIIVDLGGGQALQSGHAQHRPPQEWNNQWNRIYQT